MSVVQRHSLAAAGLLCLAALCPVTLSGQPRRGPNADTPILLVATFRTAGTDARIGIEGAEAVRDRVQRERRPEDLFVVPRSRMNEFLVQSGYPADSAISLSDLKLLAQNFRADAIVDGIVSKTATGVSVSARLVLPSNLALVQPLPVVEAPTLAEAAKQLERHLEEAQRSLLDFRKCTNALSAQKYEEAQAAAQLGIVHYPSSTLSRLCLMDAYSREQQPMDSVIRAAEAVLRIDSTSVLALMNLTSSYRDKHDTANAIDAMRRLVVYRPDLRPELLQLLGQFNRPKLALAIIADMLRENPQDPALLKQRWHFLLEDHEWKEALRAGEELVRADSSSANADYFTRSMATAMVDSQPALAVDIGTRAVAKFPSDASLWMILARAQRKVDRRADAVVSVRRALALDPATEIGWPLLISLQVELGQLDSAVASARLALAAKADSNAVRAMLGVPVATSVKIADSLKTRSAWLNVVRLTSEADSVAPSADTKYFLALGAFQVGLDILQTMHTPNCDEATMAEQMWATAAINAPLGARAGEAQKQGAAQIMTAIEKYSGAIMQAKAACKKRPRRGDDALE